MFRPNRYAWLLAVVVFGTSFSQLSVADERTAAELLPGSTVVYAEMASPAKLVQTLLEHPLRKKIESIEDVRKGLESPQAKQFQSVLGFVEVQIGMTWQEALAALTHGGLYAAADAETQGGVVLLKARDEESLKKTFGMVVGLAKKEAEDKGRGDSFENKEYRGLTALKVNQAVFAQLGTWLMISNKSELAKVIADGYLDGNKRSLADTESFKAARDSMEGQPTAWVYTDIKTLRDAGAAKELFREKSDNPGVELLFGGILSTLAKAPYSTTALHVDKQSIRLRGMLPHDPSWTSETRQFFFGKGGTGTAPPPLKLNGTLLSIDTYRDIGEFWLAKEDLFVENIVAQLSQADSQFSTIFSGLDFGQEVLGAMRPEIQIVVTRQDYEKLKTPAPDIKLPAGAFVFRMHEPEKLQRRFKVAFQSAIGLTNLNLAQQGQPQLDLETERRGDALIVSSSYLPDDTKEGAIAYNFSPSIAFVGDRFVVASTRELAGELVELFEKPAAEKVGDESTDNSRLRFDIHVLHDVLQDNRKHLVAQNALENGYSKAEAEKQIGIVFELLEAAKEASMRLANDGKSITLDLELNFEKVQD